MYMKNIKLAAKVELGFLSCSLAGANRGSAHILK